jgi:uncharacterized phiE125 gp8 family phage protein
MTITKVTDATVEPLTLAQAKAHLREDLVDTDNDSYITSLITVARTAAENRLQRTLLQTTWLLTQDGFDAALKLQMPRIISVEWLKYVDADGVLRTLDAAGYLVDTASEPGRVVPAYGTSWPATRCQPGAVTVQYKAGYGTAAAAVPGPIVSWIKLALTDLYERRGRSAEKPALPQDFADGLLDAYKVWGC